MLENKFVHNTSTQKTFNMNPGVRDETYVECLLPRVRRQESASIDYARYMQQILRQPLTLYARF